MFDNAKWVSGIIVVILLVLGGCHGGQIKEVPVEPGAETAPPEIPSGTGTSVVIKDLSAANVSVESGNVLVASLSCTASQPNIEWQSVKISRDGNAVDADIPSVKIYLDNGDGKFDEVHDNIIGMGNFSSGETEIKFAASQVLPVPDEKIGKVTPKLYFVVVAVNKTARPGLQFSIRIPADAFQTTDPAGVVSAELPFSGRPVTINPMIDYLVVSARNIAPLYLKQGEKNLPLEMLSVHAEKKEIIWTALRLTRIGNAGDSDISAVRIFAVAGANKINPGKDVKIADGTFNEGVAHLDITTPQKILTNTVLFYVAVDINPEATSGNSFGIKCEDVSAFVVTEPNAVSPNGFPFASGDGTNGTKIGLNYEDVLRERLKEKDLVTQEREMWAQKYYETAEKLFKESNYQEALDNVQKALQYNPYHVESQKLLTKLRSLIIGSAADDVKLVMEDAVNRLNIKVQQVEMEVRHHFLTADELMQEEKFKEAIQEYEAIEEKLKWDPYGFKELAHYRQESQSRLKLAQERLKAQQDNLAILQRRAAEELARVEDERRHNEFNQRIKQLFQQAVLDFSERRYKEAERLADKILDAVPNFPAAAALKNDCLYAQHKKVQEEYIKLKIQNWKLFQEDFDESLIPYAIDHWVRYDKEAWKKAGEREPVGLAEEKVTEDPDVLEIRRTMETARLDNVTINKDRTLNDFLGLINQRYNISYVFDDAEAQTRLGDGTQEFGPLYNVTLNMALKYALKPYKLTYIIRNKTICIVTEEKGVTDKQIRVYNVDDLIYQVPNFEAPSIEQQFTMASGQAFPQPPAVNLPPKPTMQLDSLKDLIQNTIANGTWKGQAGANNPIGEIGKIGSNKLMIVHSAKVQKEIKDFLQMLRSFTGTMIAIQANFLQVSDDFLEDVGVQLSDLAGVPNVVGGGVPGYRRAPPAANYDLRFRGDYPFTTGAVQDIAAAVGGRLADTGGLGLQYTFLGQNQLNLIARSLEKKEKGVILDSPKVMALNAQRVYALFVRQQAYIKDLEAASGAQAFSPVLDTLQTGVALDVMPVMSYDRKYITLHTLPTLVSLQRLRAINIANGADVTGNPNGFFVELPWVQTQRGRTTVIVPDKGTILLGGMKSVRDENVQWGTPVLDKLPLVGSLFRRKSQTKEKNNLMIMMSAEIIELPEVEKEIE